MLAVGLTQDLLGLSFLVAVFVNFKQGWAVSM